MRMGGGALKGTIGAGGLGVLGVWVERVEAVIGFWPLFAIVTAPFVILLFIRRGEMSGRLVTIAHLIAVAWYAALVLASLGLMLHRGPEPADLFFGVFMALGAIPCAFALRDVISRRRG